MSFFQDVFGKAKKIVSDGKGAVLDALTSKPIVYNAQPKLPKAPSYIYGKDPNNYGLGPIAKPQVPRAEWGVAIKRPAVLPNMGMAQTTATDTVDNPVDVIKTVIEGGKIAVKTAPVIAKEVGQGSMRAYAGLAGLATGNNLTPRGAIQEALYGTKEEISLRSVGEEIVPKGSKFAPAVGFAVGALDLVGGGGASKIIKTLAKTDDVLEVDKVLRANFSGLKHLPKDDYTSLVELISRTKDPKEVNDILAFASKKADTEYKKVAPRVFSEKNVPKAGPDEQVVRFVRTEGGDQWVDTNLSRPHEYDGKVEYGVVKKDKVRSTGDAAKDAYGYRMIDNATAEDVVKKNISTEPVAKRVPIRGEGGKFKGSFIDEPVKANRPGAMDIKPRSLREVVAEKPKYSAVKLTDDQIKEGFSQIAPKYQKSLKTIENMGGMKNVDRKISELYDRRNTFPSYSLPFRQADEQIRNLSALRRDYEDVRKGLGMTLRKSNYAIGGAAGIEEDENGKITIDPLKAALGVAGAGAMKRVGDDVTRKLAQSGSKVSPIDSLIASGKVRVVSREGRDVYQIKKGDTWITKRDESSTLSAFAPKAKVVKEKPVVEAVRRSPVTEGAQSQALAEMDMAEAGYRIVLDHDATRSGSPVLGVSSTFPKWVPEELRSRKLFDIVSKYVEKGVPPPAHNVRQKALYDVVVEQAKMYEENMLKADKFAQEAQAVYERKLKQEALTASVKAKALPVAPSQVKSLESTAQQLVEELDLPPSKKPLSLEEIVTRTPLSAKIGLLDYIRTPDRVLEKIGFGKEARLLRTQYEEYVKELPKNLDRVGEWFKQVPSKESNVRLFEYLDGKNVKLTSQEQKIAGEIKAYLAEWADRLKLPEDNRIANYITHLFDDQLIAKEFDEDLAKIIADKVPGQVYNPFLQKRLGAKGYKVDVWAALDAYTKRATRKVHMDPALEKIRDRAGSSLEFTNLEESQFRYIQNYIDRVNMRPTRIDNAVDTTFKQIFGYKLGQRPVLRIMQAMRRMTYRGMLGLNVGSALRNLSQGVNTYAVLGEKYTAIGYAKLLNSKAREELVREGVLSNTFIQDRSINATKKAIEKADKALWVFFDAAEKVNRGSAYFGAKAKGIAQGMSEADAIEYAKKIVRKTQFSYDTVDTPLLLQPDILKTLFQFQTFTTKQIEFMGELIKDRNFAALTRYAIGGMAFVYTIGEAFGMEPKELLPFYRLGTPPSMKFPWEVAKAGFDTPDKYGNDRDLETKMKDIGKSTIGYIPAGVQAKKTIEGMQQVNEGGSFDKAGRLQFLQGQSLPEKAQTTIFGKYATKESEQYFQKEEDKARAMEGIAPTYDRVQALKAEGKDTEAQSIVDSLSEEEYTKYKEYKSQATKEKNAQLKKDLVPTYLQVQEMKKDGNAEQAQAIVDAMSEEEYKAYEAIKKEAKTIAITAEERTALETVGAYAKAFIVDPGNASKALFTNEKLGKVQGNLVELKRFYGRDYKAVDGSEAYIYEQLKLMGVDAKDRSKYNLEHIVPVSAGGDSSPANLRVVDRTTHDSWTEFDIMLGNAVKDKKINRRRAEKIARDYKNGVITREEAQSQLQ